MDASFLLNSLSEQELANTGNKPDLEAIRAAAVRGGEQALSNERSPKPSSLATSGLSSTQGDTPANEEELSVPIIMQDLARGLGASLKCTKTACMGVVYDLKHFHALPGDTALQKVQFSMTRDDRAFYLVALSVFVFGMVLAGYGAGKAIRRSRPTRSALELWR